MRERITLALKEWAIVVDALAGGRQILLLRKGGLAEATGRFEVEARAFALVPTFEHQRPEAVLPVVRSRLATLAASPPTTHVPLHHLATVEEVFLVGDLGTARRLAPHHIWSDALVRQRFEGGDGPGLTGLLVRVFRLPAPVELPLAAAGGCTSWVRLERPLEATGAVPVLEEAAFATRCDAVRRAVGPLTRTR